MYGIRSYMSIITSTGPQLQGLKSCIPEGLAIGAAGGSAFAPLLSIGLGLIHPQHPWLASNFFGLGLALGLLAGPLLDLALVIGDRRRRFILGALLGEALQGSSIECFMSENLRSSLRDLRIELLAVTRQLASISDRLGALQSEGDEGFSSSFLRIPDPSASCRLYT